MKKLVQISLAFAAGLAVAGFISYNVWFSGLLYAQINSSNLFNERLKSNTKLEIRESLTKVIIPAEACRAWLFLENPIALESPHLAEEVEKAFKALNIPVERRTEYCKGKV